MPGNHTRSPPPEEASLSPEVFLSIQEVLSSSPGYTSQVSYDSSPSLALGLFSIANIVSDYTEKLCQSFLCLREGHLSFAFLNLKMWALAHITLCNFS